MPRFFIDYVPSEIITIMGDDARHIGRSLRMKIGDEITFCHGGMDFLCVISNISENTVKCIINDTIPSNSEPNINLTLYQAFPKGDKFELIIQKTVELGIKKIVPFISKRCVSRPDEKSFSKKLERYKKISAEAAKQAGRGIIPEITSIMTFEDAIKDMSNADISLICYENGGKRLGETKICDAKNIAIMIGSEGGFEHGEVDKATENGAIPIWLGERILRCETCPISMTSIIMNLTGNM